MPCPYRNISRNFLEKATTFENPMITLDNVITAVNLPDFDPAPARQRMMPQADELLRQFPSKSALTRQAGVLVLIYPEAGGDLQVVLTRRTDSLRGHSGQVSFPGGKRDPEDESFTMTALREACEEIGICSDDLTVIGALSTLYIPPSDYEVFPTVATLLMHPQFQPNPTEVAEIFTLRLDDLLDESHKREELWDFPGGYKICVPFYAVGDHKVWGATATMLSELELRLRTAVGS